MDMAMRFADVYLMHEADRYVDFSPQQSKDLKPEVQNILNKIQKEDFLKFAGFAEEVEESLRTKGYQREKVDAWLKKAEDQLRVTLERFQPTILRIAKEATPDQEKNFAKEIEKVSQKNLDAIDTTKKSVKTNKKRITKWTDDLIGDFTSQQDSDLEAFATDHPYPVTLQIKNREKLLAEFLKTSGEDRQAWIRRFYSDPEARIIPEYKKARAQWREGLKDYLGKLWLSMDDRQKKNLFENLKKKAAEFRALSAKK